MPATSFYAVNRYAPTPIQHPNLIIGSLQLLFWLFFRPQVWKNYLDRIYPSLKTESQKANSLKRNKLYIRRLFIQGYIILPLVSNLTLVLALWGLGKLVEKTPVFFVLGTFIGLVLGVTFSLFWEMVQRAGSSITFGILFSLTFAVVFNLLSCVLPELAFSMVFWVSWGIAFGIAFGVGFGVAVDASSDLVFLLWGIVFGFAFGIGSGFAVLINIWRPLLMYPLLFICNVFLYELEKRRSNNQIALLSWHPAFWDEYQWIPLYGLDKHLVLVIERNLLDADNAIEYLSSSRQRWVVQEVSVVAQIERDARSLERCADVQDIRKIYKNLVVGNLESSIGYILGLFIDTSKDVDAALNQKSSYNQRLALKHVADRLNGHSQNLKRGGNKYAVRFSPIADRWYIVVTNSVSALAKESEREQEINSPYIIGIPLTLEQEIFAGRSDIASRIEQLLLDRRRPPLLLYGQRRMGKTSLLNNLRKLLPSNIIPMFVDLQGAPTSASNYTGFLYNIARGMISSAKQQSVILPPLTREALENDPFTCFDEWLDEVESILGENTALLMLDEFEVLDGAISKGRFDEEDVLGMIRHLIQHRPRFKVMLAGSHTIEEYQRWASYLINVQVVRISYLEEKEARQLIEHPVADFTLRYEPDAVEYVLHLTRGHPFLVQLLCAEIVAYKNEQDPDVRRKASIDDVEAAIPSALSSGSFFFADIQNNQVDAAGRNVLQLIGLQGEGAVISKSTILACPDVVETTINLLLQRELIEEFGDGYRYQVELIRRWFAENVF